jgi:hypothetical protein
MFKIKYTYLYTRLIYSQIQGLDFRNLRGGTDVCCECCVLLGRVLCDGTINGTEECACVVACACVGACL